jgi:hypothetical protein
MYVQRIDAGGHTVGAATAVGPADPTSQPMWSPLGRYLVWHYQSPTAASDHGAVVELYDSTLRALHPFRNLSAADIDATGVGLQVVQQTDDTNIDDLLYDVHARSTGAGSATFSHIMSAVAVGHTQAVVETGTFNGNGKPATLWLLPGAGSPVKLGTVAPLSFLGQHQAPAIGRRTSAVDGVHAALVTGLGQDGGCANGQDVHLLDLTHDTDTVVALPLTRGDLLAPSYSPAGVLGGVSVDCGYEGNDRSNSFVELHGTRWTTVVVGATVAARGPGGLLAVQVGTFHAREFAPVPSQDHPLEIRTAKGETVATLPTSYAVAWTQASVPPPAV